MGNRLSEHELALALQALPLWEVRNNAIERTYQFRDFVRAMMFVNQIAQIAEAEGHHPDITINYNKVRLSLTSHDSGGLTERDIKLAERFNEVSL